MINYETIGLTKLGMQVEIQCFKKLNIVYRANYGTLCASGYHPDVTLKTIKTVRMKLRITLFSQN